MLRGIPSFTAGEAMPAYARVKIKPGSTMSPVEVVLAGATDAAVGMVEYEVPVAAIGQVVAVRPTTDPGIHKLIAAGNITSTAALYGAAGGKVASSGDTSIQAIALESATVDEEFNAMFYL